MTDDEMKRKLTRLLASIEDAYTAQGPECRHQHHGHRIVELFEAEGTAKELMREFELREGERLMKPAPALGMEM